MGLAWLYVTAGTEVLIRRHFTQQPANDEATRARSEARFLRAASATPAGEVEGIPYVVRGAGELRVAAGSGDLNELEIAAALDVAVAVLDRIKTTTRAAMAEDGLAKAIVCLGILFGPGGVVQETDAGEVLRLSKCRHASS